MKTARTALKLTLPFILGVLVGDWLEVPFIIALTLWTTFFLCLLALIYSGRLVPYFRKWIGFALVSTFFTSGILSFSTQLPAFDDQHYTHHLLPGDQLILNVSEYQKGSGSYDKVIGQLEYRIYEKQQQPISGKLLCYLNTEGEHLDVGDQLIINAAINPIENSNNPGGFDQSTFWKYQGIYHMAFATKQKYQVLEKNYEFNTFWTNLRAKFIAQLEDRLTGRNKGLAVALAMGQKSMLEKETNTAFANAGAMHVLAVSGLHVGILMGIVQWICFQFAFLRRRNLYIFLGIIVVWAFAFLTGGSPSVLRAALMFSLMAFGQLRGISFFSLNSLVFAALFLLIINPLYVFNIGFQLSFLAMLGISLFYKTIQNLFYFRYKVVQWFWQGTALGIAAQIGTLPITLYYFNQFPNYFVLSNIGLMVFAFLALAAVILYLITYSIPYISDIVTWITDFIFTLLHGFIDFINTLPATVSRGFDVALWQVILAYIFIFMIWWSYKERQLKIWKFASVSLFTLAVLLIIQRTQNWNEDRFIVFNDRYQIALYKKGERIVVFYDYKAKGNEDKIAFIADSYHRAVGGELLYHIIPSGSHDNNALVMQFEKTKIEVIASKKGNTIRFSDHSFFLPKSNHAKVTENDLKIIDGNWLRKPYDKADISTRDQAFEIVI